MDLDLSGVTDSLQSSAWLLFKMLLTYILIPEIVAIIVVGGILKIRGGLFKVIMIGVTFVCLIAFLKFGLPEIVAAVDGL
ncbi:hypothetical protein [Paenibacillus sp. SYP-B4298]|uniref:hypothetical protein n=1 Tax=Paenibacillus sp. SYP-B4298 TaxID=2996034 RepID=UPI0022DE17DC|nr:hypothetical protein [Paenibacillus sp. SYP-B4298]